MSGMTNSEDYLHLDRTKLMEGLRDLSKKYNEAYALQLKTETQTKTLYAGLYVKYKTGAEKMSIKEVDNFIPGEFEVNDMNVIYREKTVK